VASGDADCADTLSADRPWLVLYDSACGFCKWLLAGFLRWDRASRLRPVALQQPEADGLLADLEPAGRTASWHLISPGATRRSGGAAIPALLRLLPGGRFAAPAFERLPDLTERGYTWVAEHRTGLSKWVPANAKRRAAERVRRCEHELDSPGPPPV
jgi:predicted DCC family thiol-disulfide oxidoreductase YuxK